MDVTPRVALLIDVVASRAADRSALHAAILAAADAANAAVPAVDPLYPTVGDELQGVYRSLGDALSAAFTLRLTLAPGWDVRCGLGGGEVIVVDAARRIQDGSAWWLAREAIDWVAERSTRPGYEAVRTAIRDERPAADPLADPTARLVDAHIARLRPAVVGTLRGLWEGLDNAAAAEREGISPSANSQRIRTNQLRPLVDTMRALGELP